MVIFIIFSIGLLIYFHFVSINLIIYLLHIKTRTNDDNSLMFDYFEKLFFVFHLIRLIKNENKMSHKGIRRTI